MNYNKLSIIPICLTFGLIAAAIIACTAIGYGPITDYIEAKYLAAQADADNAAAHLYEAQAEKSRAEGEAAIFYAAAASVRKDSKIVAWYAIRDDVRFLAVTCSLTPFWFGFGTIAGLLAYQEWDKRRLEKCAQSSPAA